MIYSVMFVVIVLFIRMVYSVMFGGNVLFIRMIYSVMFVIMFCLLE